MPTFALFLPEQLKWPAILTSILGVSLGCSSRAEYEDTGSLCYSRADNHTALRITADPCLSSACEKVTQRECDARLDERTISVSSRFVIKSRKYGACSDDCVFVRCEVQVGELDEGEYTVHYGGQSFTLPDATLAEATSSGAGGPSALPSCDSLFP